MYRKMAAPRTATPPTTETPIIRGVWFELSPPEVSLVLEAAGAVDVLASVGDTICVTTTVDVPSVEVERDCVALEGAELEELDFEGVCAPEEDEAAAADELDAAAAELALLLDAAAADEELAAALVSVGNMSNGLRSLELLVAALVLLSTLLPPPPPPPMLVAAALLLLESGDAVSELPPKILNWRLCPGSALRDLPLTFEPSCLVRPSRLAEAVARRSESVKSVVIRMFRSADEKQQRSPGQKWSRSSRRGGGDR